jgi:hypothetical protein
MKHHENKKHSYTSPQKTQTSIVNYTNQKKMNSNPTPPRTAINRAYKAIADQAIASPPKPPSLSNNPYQLLVDVEELSDNDKDNVTHEIDNVEGMERDNDQDLSSELPLPSSGKLLLSRKAQQTLRKICSLRKNLLDDRL